MYINGYEFLRSDTKFYISIQPILFHMHLFERSEKKNGNNYKTLKLKVLGMHCEGCNESIKEFLSKIDGIRNIQADFSNEEVRMEIDENRIYLDQIRGAIRKAGFIPGIERIES